MKCSPCRAFAVAVIMMWGMMAHSRSRRTGRVVRSSIVRTLMIGSKMEILLLLCWTCSLSTAQMLSEADILLEPSYTSIWKDRYFKGFPHASLLQKGYITATDKDRLKSRQYPHGNSTATTLSQYKKDVPNGNSYNMVGDSVGDLPTTLFDRHHGTLSVSRSNGGAASTNRIVLFAGGVLDQSVPGVAIQSDVVDIYDESTRTWTTSVLSAPRQDLSCVAVLHLILCAGGWSNNNDEEITQSSIVDIYDTNSKSWLTPTSLSEARSNMLASPLRGKVYFAGGNAGHYSQVYYSDRVDVYNGATQTWDATLKLPQARAYLAGGCAIDTCVFGGGYYLGHYSSFRNPTITNRIDVLNVTGRTWEKLQLLAPRASMGSTVQQNRFVVFAGGIGPDMGRTDMINVYDVLLKRFTHGYLSLPRTGTNCLSIDYISVCGGGLADGGTVDKGVQWQKEGSSTRAQRLDVISIFKRVTDITTQYEWMADALATSASNQFAVASEYAFYIAGGVDNRRRTTDRVEMFRRRPDSKWNQGILGSTVQYEFEWPQWRPIWKNETCKRIWCDGITRGPPMHSHGCGDPPSDREGIETWTSGNNGHFCN